MSNFKHLKENTHKLPHKKGGRMTPPTDLDSSIYALDIYMYTHEIGVNIRKTDLIISDKLNTIRDMDISLNRHLTLGPPPPLPPTHINTISSSLYLQGFAVRDLRHVNQGLVDLN